jgi:hypothetical protein
MGLRPTAVSQARRRELRFSSPSRAPLRLRGWCSHAIAGSRTEPCHPGDSTMRAPEWGLSEGERPGVMSNVRVLVASE